MKTSLAVIAIAVAAVIGVASLPQPASSRTRTISSGSTGVTRVTFVITDGHPSQG